MTVKKSAILLFKHSVAIRAEQRRAKRRQLSQEDATANDLSPFDSFSKRDIQLLTPRSKGVYIQYVKDSDDKLLVDGYFREHIRNRVLPPDINRIIAAYYLKSYSIRSLHERITRLGMVYLFHFAIHGPIPTMNGHKYGSFYFFNTQ